MQINTSHNNQFTSHHFEQVSVDTLGGYDLTNLSGGNQRDVLRTVENGLTFESTAKMLQIVNAESHQVDLGGGVDEVFFNNFEGMDLLEAIGDQATAWVGDQRINVTEIDFLEARARAGETGTYEIAAVDYLFLLDGSWQEADE